MGIRSGIRLDRWTRRVWDGGGWLQGQVVGGFPRSCAECVQCVREQLVERALCAPSTRLPQVSVNYYSN